MVAVRPDWTGPEALFGYRDALRETKDGRDAWFVPKSLEFALAARAEPSMPYLIVLDEMNLAHVERYFSDFLSGVESGEPILPNLVKGEDGEYRVAAGERDLVELPTNLFVIGTVNVDETTYMFSPKVLDRAFTFEIRTATHELDPAVGRPHSVAPAPPTFLEGIVQAARRDDWHLGDASDSVSEVATALKRLHTILTLSGDEFGHRVFFESLRFAAVYAELGNDSADRALDQIVMLKVLPRIHGSRKRVEPLLQRLLRFSHSPDLGPEALDGELPTGAPRLPVTAAKVARMLTIVAADQFVSFTE
jgi:5-methylcytosine-specific restriction endonuclease McrBC GTP-binding regulatory subunit McrB